MSQIYQKMYTTLFNRMEDVMASIDRKPGILDAQGRDPLREVFLQIQAALLEAENIYMDAEDD